MKPNITWILVADGARARILVNQGPGKGIEQLAGADFRADHSPSGALMSDRPGRTFDSAGDGRHAMGAKTDPHTAAKRDFAGQIADFLEHNAQQKKFGRLIILAAAKTLGDLRAALPDPVRALVTAEVAKDLTHVPNEELLGHLGDVLAT